MVVSGKMTGMITISELQPDQVREVKAVIAEVARRMFEPQMSSEEFTALLDEEHEFHDIDDHIGIYSGQLGLFLVAQEDGRIVGTGAVKPSEGESAELKRIWLLQEYHGQGIGYRLVTQLFEFARLAGYKRMVLQTDVHMERAVSFYRRLGFKEIPPYYETPWPDEIFMALDLNI